MDLYHLLKLVHVLAAILWVGGGLGLLLFGLGLRRRGDARAVLDFVAALGASGQRLFLPASLVVLATGLLMVWTGGLGWSAWVVLALAGVALTIGLGAGVLGPRIGRIGALRAAGSEAEAAALVPGLMRLAKIDYAIHFAVVALMVLKPGWGDAAVLGSLAALVALGLLFVLRPEERTAAGAA